jgi:hypothetical protein
MKLALWDTSGARWEWAVHLKDAVTACPAVLRRVDPQNQAITEELCGHSFWRAFDDGKVRSLAMSLATPEKIRCFKGSFILEHAHVLARTSGVRKGSDGELRGNGGGRAQECAPAPTRT